MLTRGCKYAIKSLLYLSSAKKQFSVKEVAAAIGTPQAFTSKILQQLVQAGIVSSVRGFGGGFSVQDEAIKNITILTIIRAIEGDSISTNCFFGVDECTAAKPCPLHHLYAPIREQLNQKLFNISLEEILRNKQFKEINWIK
ncbi:MAG: Rrf2 family transcriptional regulator [Flavobacteriales bacterium]|nr:Rrf2 family transcriptional regulator [Flavobacteriales bacterium]